MLIKFNKPPLKLNQIVSETPRNLLYKKITNYINLYKCSRKMESFVNAYPIRLQIDPSNICNLRCPLCPTNNEDKLKLNKTKKIMSFDDFKKIMDEVGDYVFHIDLYGTGEPLLNPSLIDMIKYCKSKGIYVTLSSNLNNFHKHDPQDIVDSGLDQIVLSIDGMTQETYEQYRIGGNLEKVLENAQKIILEKKKNKSKKPYIIWQYLVFKHNIKEINNAKLMAKNLSFDAIEFERPLGLLGANIILNKHDLINVSKQYLPPLDSEYSRYDKNYADKFGQKSCNWLWKQAFINPNGLVSPCCGVWDEKFSYGNCLNTNFFQVWNNEKYTKSREVIRDANKNFVSDNNNSGDLLICQICSKKGNYI